MAELVIAGIEGNKIIPSADAKIITLTSLSLDAFLKLLSNEEIISFDSVF